MEQVLKMALVRHHQQKKSDNYMRQKCKIQAALLWKKWRLDKRKHRAKKKKAYTHIPPPVQTGGSDMLPPPPPTPEDLQAIARHVQETQQLGGSPKSMEAGTTVTQNEVIISPGHPTVFSHPTQIIITGPTKAGKTTLTTQILSNRDVMFPDPPLQEIYWFYSMEPSVSQARKDLPGVNFIQGQPTFEKLNSLDKRIPKLVVLDDMMDMTDKKGTFEELKKVFTALSHHGNMSLMFLVQDLYVNKNMTRLANQAENVLAMCNGAATYQLGKLANKLFGPGHEPFIRWAVSDVKSHSKYGYLLLSTAAGLPECYKVRSRILPGDQNAFYIKRGSLKTEEYLELKADGERKEVPLHHQEAGTSGESRAERT